MHETMPMGFIAEGRGPRHTTAGRPQMRGPAADPAIQTWCNAFMSTDTASLPVTTDAGGKDIE